MDPSPTVVRKRRRFSPAVSSAVNPQRGVGTQLVYGTVELAAGSAKQQVTIANTANVNVVNTDPIGVNVANADAIKVEVDNEPGVRMLDGVGGSITSTNGSLDVNVANTSAINVSFDNDPGVRILDGSGAALTSTEGALDVTIANAPFVRIGDADGSPISSELGALKVALQASDGSALDTTAGALNVAVPTAVKMADGSGNLLVSNAGALTVSVLNTPIVHIADSLGNQLKSTGNALDINGPVRLSDGSGNAIGSTDGALDVTVTNPVTVAGSLAEDYSYYFNTVLPSAWTSPYASVAIAAGETQLVGSFGGTLAQYPGQLIEGIAVTVTVESTSEEDTASGSGARQVRLTGLSGAYQITSELLTLTGSTPVSSTNTYIYIFNLQVVTTGSLGANEGILSVEVPAITPFVCLSVPATACYADSGTVFVPPTHNYFLQSASIFSHTTGTLNIRATSLKTSATTAATLDITSPGMLIQPIQLTTPMNPQLVSLNAVIPGPAVVFAVATVVGAGTVGVSLTGFME